MTGVNRCRRISRRAFLAEAGAFASCPLWMGMSTGLGVRSYSVALIGDMHYDADPMEKFHAEFLKVWGEDPDESWRLGEFRRNAAMWNGIGRKILASAGASATPDTAFVAQLGDLVQGDCRDGETHRRMLAEAKGLLSESFGPDRPIVLVCGNHDLRAGTSRDGNDQDAAEAYRVFVGRDTTYAFRQGPDLYLVIDFNRPSADRVKKLLAANENVRYTFILTHGPLSPMDLMPRRWFLYGDEKDDPVRNEMRALFARRNAIVLAGHVHSLEHKEFAFPEGRISELVLSTIVRSFDKPLAPEPDVIATDPARYGRVKEQEVSWVPGLKELFDEWRPHLREYYASRATGHYRLRVSDAGVWVDYYGLDARMPTKTFELRRNI